MLASTGGKWADERARRSQASVGCRRRKLLWTGLGHIQAGDEAAAFSPDGRQVASASTVWGRYGEEVKIWETATGKAVRTLSGVRQGAFGVAYSADGRWLATAGVNGEVRLWNPRTGKAGLCLRGHVDNVFGVAFSPDSRLLASASRDGTARIWEVVSGKLKCILSGPVDLRSVAFSPDGRRLVTASYDQSVKVWDVASGQLLHPYWRHTGAAVLERRRLRPGLPGRWAASADNTGQVQIWDAETGRPIRTVCGHTGTVPSVAFSPEGRRLATGGLDRMVRIWDVTRDQEVCRNSPQSQAAQECGL